MRVPFRKKKELKKQVTTETIEEHREEVLAKGRKFKYPFQYAKHRLVINTIIIGVVAVILLVGFGWLQLYKFQSTHDILYRFTKVIPVPVARVDGENVRFSDYLMILKSSIAGLEAQEGTLAGTEADEMIRMQYKREALDTAIQFAFALKLARELGIEVTDEQVAEAQREHRTVDGVERSEESFANIVRMNFGLTVEEYGRLLMLSLTRKAVSSAIDEVAVATADEVERMLDGNGGNFAEVAEALGEKVSYEGPGEFVSTMNLDGGRAEMAGRLEVGEWSERFASRNGDGYYFVKLLEKGEGQVKYVSLRVAFLEFGRRMERLREEGRIEEFIEIRRTDGGGEEKN